MKNLIKKTVILVGLMSLAVYAADDVKIKLTDTGGASNFAIQDSDGTSVFRVNSDGHAQILSNSEMRLYNAGNTFYTGFKAPVLASNLMFTMPTSFGADGQVLKSNGAGVLSWVDKESPLSFNLPLSRTADAISILQASGSQNGYLASADWTTFNNKQGALGFTPENSANKGAANGYAGLGANSRVPTAQLGSGTADSTTYLRGDQTWATLASSGITSLNSQTGATQTFANDTNVTISSATNIHTLGWTGTLSIVRGGTGQSTATAAFDALDPLTTKGDIIVHNGTNSIRLGVGSNDQVLIADSTQVAGVKWATLNTRNIGKTADQSVTNSTTLVSDTELQFTMEAGATYVFIFKLLVSNNNSATPDWKSAILASTGTSFLAVQSGAEPAAAAFPQVTTTNCTTPSTLVNGTIVADANVPFNVEIQGIVTDNGSAGTVYLQYAENTAGAGTSITVKKGSYVTVYKQ